MQTIRSHDDRFDAIPRPPHHRVLGHLPEWVGKDNASKVLDTLLAYAESCGGLARIPLGPARLLLLSDPEPIAELLSADEANVKGWPYTLTRVVLDNVLLLNGDAWARSRSAYRRALRAADVPRAGDAALDGFLAELTRRPAGSTVELQAEVRGLVADCVTELLCSARYPRQLEPHRERVQYELAAVGIDLQCQPWAYASPRRWIEMRRSVEAMRAFFATRVEERLASSGADELGAPEHRDALAGFLEVAATGELGSGSTVARDGLVNLFFTAHDVLTASASFCLWLLATHPEAQDEVRAGLRAGDREPLACALRESLRLYPGYPLFSRRTRAPVAIGGHRVPAGTEVLVSPWVLHRLERHWPDAGAFRPERWRGRADGPIGPGPRDGYMPFGGGHRSCIAFALALPLLEQIVRRVITTVRLEPVGGHTPDIVYWGSASSTNGLPARVTPLS